MAAGPRDAICGRRTRRWGWRRTPAAARAPLLFPRLRRGARAGLGGRPALRLALAGLGRDELQRFFEGHGGDHVLAGERGVHLAVLHVRAVAARVERHRLVVVRMLAQHLERAARAELLRLLEEGHRAVERDVEDAFVLRDRLEL